MGSIQGHTAAEKEELRNRWNKARIPITLVRNPNDIHNQKNK